MRCPGSWSDFDWKLLAAFPGIAGLLAQIISNKIGRAHGRRNVQKSGNLLQYGKWQSPSLVDFSTSLLNFSAGRDIFFGACLIF
jgi:hypothetical protein